MSGEGVWGRKGKEGRRDGASLGRPMNGYKRAGKSFGEPWREEEGLPGARRVEGGDEDAASGVKAKGAARHGGKGGPDRESLMLKGEASHLCKRQKGALSPEGKGREGGPLPGRRWAASPLSHTQRAPASPTLQPGLAEEVLLRPRPRGSIRPRDGRAQRRPQPRRGHCSSPGFRGYAREANSRRYRAGRREPC